VASYDALINLKLSSQGLKDLKRIEGAVDKINKPVRTANRTARAEAQILDSKRAQQDMMSKTRRVGDLVQKQADKGLKMGRAQEAIQKSALMNQKKEFVESEKLLKVALNELKIQKAITRETAQQATNKSRTVKSSGGLDVLTGISQSRFGSAKTIGSPRYFASRAGMMQGPAAPPYSPGMYGSSPIGGSKFMFGSPAQVAFSGSGMGRSPILGSKDLVGSPKNILDVAKQNVLPVKGTKDLVGSPKYYEEVNKEALKVAKMKGNVLPVGGLKHLVGSPAYFKDQEEQLATLLKGKSTGFKASQYGPQQFSDPGLQGQSSPLNFGRRGELLRGRAGTNRFSLRNMGRRFDKQSALISGAFPLLFGQGPVGAAAGAIGGGVGGMFGQMGGFAGGIAATALVQQIQQVIVKLGDLGKAMSPFVQDTNALIDSMGLAGTAEAKRIQIIEQLQGKQAAFNAAMQKMKETIGTEATKRLEEFGQKASLVGSEFKIAMLKMQDSILIVINAVDKLLGVSKGAEKARLDRFIENSKNPSIVDRRTELEAIRKNKNARGRVKDPEREAQLEKELEQIARIGISLEDQRVKMSEITLEHDKLVQKAQEEKDLKEAVKKLTEGGMSEAIAKEVAQREQVRDKALEQLDTEAKILMEKRKELDFNEENKQQFKEIKEQLDDIFKTKQKITKETKDATDAIEEQGKAIKKVKVTKEEIANLLANEMTNALMGLIEGTKSLGESLASIAKSLAKMFLNAAFQNIFNRMFSITGSEQGSYSRAGGFKAFQYGGVVNQPTLGLMGEGGEPEYVIPASKMDGAMARYSAGARGGAVIPGGSHESGTVAGGSGNAIVEYTGPVLNFNGDEYVPKSAVPEIINTAAKQGANAGRSQAFATLKNSRSQRATLGL